MAKGSQLSQLKSALSDAGLSRKSIPSKKRKRSGSKGVSRDVKTSKLQEIHEKLNPFDVKVTKLKHDLAGRKLKGIVGKPAVTKQAGLEQRKKTLLKEYKEREHAGGIVDRRIGENDPTMTPEERMLQRFTRERQRASKGVTFNLDDEVELTHYGQSLSKADDFEGLDLYLRQDEDEDDNGQIDADTVRRKHFVGMDEEEEEADPDQPPRKKTKAEVMAEVMAKSKEHKHQRQLERQEDSETRHQLDEEFDSLRALLMSESTVQMIRSDASLKNLPPTAENEPSALFHRKEDQDYDIDVRELAMDRRARPKDRTKTEEELALEAKEALEKAERKRMKRMMGEDDESSEEEGGRRKKRRERGGDDLEDDFQDSENELRGLGAGLGDEKLEVNDESSDEENATGKEEESSSDEEEAESDEAEETDADELESIGESAASDASEEEEEPMIPGPSTSRKKPSKRSEKEVPFTFSCPETHDDFLDIIENLDDNDVPTVVERIKTLYHPSLAVGNKDKLKALTGILIDHILYITSPPNPNFALMHSLIPHLHSLTKSYPVSSAEHFISKLKLMMKNFTRGLKKGPLLESSKTWPRPAELALLWTIKFIWPTSDRNHRIVSPTRLLMGAYLGLSRVRNLRDIASGLFLCTLWLEYEQLSHRLVPECTNFLAATLLHLAPHSFESRKAVPGLFPLLDYDSASCQNLRLEEKAAKSLECQQPHLINILTTPEKNVVQNKSDLLGATFGLVASFAEMYKGLPGFIELYEPILGILDGVQEDKLSASLQAKLKATKEPIIRLLKFAKAERRPLRLQAHKPIPIASYIPKFNATNSSYLRRQDPDHERAAAQKLRHQYKQERKGAVRELRKDAKFLAAVQQKEQQEKDRKYKEGMNKAFSSLESERAEQKRMEKEKSKEKRRAGRK